MHYLDLTWSPFVSLIYYQLQDTKSRTRDMPVKQHMKDTEGSKYSSYFPISRFPKSNQRKIIIITIKILKQCPIEKNTARVYNGSSYKFITQLIICKSRLMPKTLGILLHKSSFVFRDIRRLIFCFEDIVSINIVN